MRKKTFFWGGERGGLKKISPSWGGKKEIFLRKKSLLGKKGGFFFPGRTPMGGPFEGGGIFKGNNRAWGKKQKGGLFESRKGGPPGITFCAGK